MDSTQGKISHVSETATVKCRVCKIVLRRKNYKAHLKAYIPKMILVTCQAGVKTK